MVRSCTTEIERITVFVSIRCIQTTRCRVGALRARTSLRLAAAPKSGAPCLGAGSAAALGESDTGATTPAALGGTASAGCAGAAGGVGVTTAGGVGGAGGATAGGVGGSGAGGDGAGGGAGGDTAGGWGGTTLCAAACVASETVDAMADASTLVLWTTLAESPGLATRTSMLMLQPVHCVTDATWSGGGVASSQFHFQLITTVVVFGPRSDRSSGGGSSLQFQVQFQTMIFGDVGAESALIPLELLLMVLPLEPAVDCEGGATGAGGV
jgi:hypothetical protein